MFSQTKYTAIPYKYDKDVDALQTIEDIRIKEKITAQKQRHKFCDPTDSGYYEEPQIYQWSEILQNLEQ